MSSTQPARTGRIANLLTALGPGLVTGAADDDPSGIATYSLAGARRGTGLLWMAWLTWPLMAAGQMMCARIGMVTGRYLLVGRLVVGATTVALFAAAAAMFLV